MNLVKALLRLVFFWKKSRSVVPVVRLSGVIASSSQMRRGLSLEAMEPQLKKAFAIRGAKAVALIINSPGGSPVQSALIGKRVRDLARKANVPVLAFCEDVAASGGMLYNGSGDRIGSWSARLETLWSDADDSLRVYPALTWSPSQLLSTFVRVQVLLLNSGRWSTVDDPASDGAIGVTWTPITGLSVSLYGTGSTDPDLGTITTAVRYTF